MSNHTQNNRINGVQYGNRKYQEYAKRVNDSRGTGPGYPNQFRHHPESWVRSNQTREFIVPANHETTKIKQMNRNNSIIGRYDAMVPDLPFSDHHEKRKTQALHHVGLGAIATGAAFVF